MCDEASFNEVLQVGGGSKISGSRCCYYNFHPDYKFTKMILESALYAKLRRKSAKNIDQGGVVR